MYIYIYIQKIVAYYSWGLLSDNVYIYDHVCNKYRIIM